MFVESLRGKAAITFEQHVMDVLKTRRHHVQATGHRQVFYSATIEVTGKDMLESVTQYLTGIAGPDLNRAPMLS